ncbi:MAG: ATP-binding protein [Muricomes sp.]|uniref:sensor histidine kinase n=1 Tax=Faecalicatena contorta TaxID=39482 RepID=UPI002EA8DFAB|nr:ATP-binding protein [Muricomes sp.]
MNKTVRKFLYRVFCFISLAIAVYLVIDLKISRTLDFKMIIVFILLLVVIIWGTIDWKLSNDIIREQEKELKMYQHYIQPLEELVKEIRARQHEFDNHLNAVLNMHLTVDSYEELVRRQSEYVKEISREGVSQYLLLLKISDKVLAGFLYSKIVSSREGIETEIEVRSREIISRVSEHSLIEIVGVLVDNAYEACPEEGGRVRMILDSRQDHLIFQIFNQHEKISLEEIGHFFENGFTTKSKKRGDRGLGLYRAKMIAEKAGGEITVGQEEIGGENYIQFAVVI